MPGTEAQSARSAKAINHFIENQSVAALSISLAVGMLTPTAP
jgi:hypothetical protein